MRLLPLLLAASAATGALAQEAAPPPPGTRTYANPIDIDYRYNFEQENAGVSFRTGADPAIVRHKDAFYLFQTLADGYWRSTNLVDWTFVEPSRWPFLSVIAPAAWSDGNRLYLMPSTMLPGQILSSTDPASGRLDFFDRRMPWLPKAMPENQSPAPGSDMIPPGPWDPALFKDDDGRWYLYWGSSNVYPMYGIEIGMEGALTYKGEAQTMLSLHPDRHGWERFGQDHSGLNKAGQPTTPFMEGAWMTKHGGRYYLQYGAPGTEFNAYANGVYVGDGPLGPFTYADYNPVAYKPGGFVEGAGHGSTVEDFHGNWWNSGTPWIGHNWDFERRIALFPAAFYPDGQMRVSTRFGDFPHWMPDGKVEDPESLFTGWMLLSYGKRATASTTQGDFAASRATDEDPRTFWVAADDGIGQTLTVDLGREATVRAVQVNFADYQAGRFADAPDIYSDFDVQASSDGRTWRRIASTAGERRDRPNAYFQLPQPERARYVRYVHGHVGAAHLAISDLRVFGTADGRAPAQPAGVTAVREQDQRNARIGWRAVPGATGYNVRWGVRPDRLTLTYQLWADDVTRGGAASLDLRALNIGVGYHVAVEAFNETGVSPLSAVVALP